MFDLAGAKVWVTGHQGMVGSALIRRLRSQDCQLLTASRQELDLRNQQAVEAWFADNKPDAVFHAAGTVGGIGANSAYPADFIYDNLAMATHVIHAAYRTKVKKLLFLGSSCIYPKFAPQPITEDALLTGALEPTNQWYAVAKIAGLKLCAAYRRQYGCDFISAMPTNLYGLHDNFDSLTSHVLPGLIARIHRAKLAGLDAVEVWGTGTPRREFLFVDDLAEALVHMMRVYSDEPPVNIGTGEDITIAELAHLVAGCIGFTGKILFDPTKPDGTPRKLLDISRIRQMGWRPSTTLQDGIARTYAWFLQNDSAGRQTQ